MMSLAKRAVARWQSVVLSMSRTSICEHIPSAQRHVNFHRLVVTSIDSGRRPQFTSIDLFICHEIDVQSDTAL